MGRIADEFSSYYDLVRVIEPRARHSETGGARIKVIAFPSGLQAVELVGMLFAYLIEIIKLRPQFSLGSLWFPSGFVCALFPKCLRGPLAILAHGSEIAPRRRGARRAIMRFTFSRADAIFANSEYVKDLLRQAGVASKVHILPCGTDVYDREISKTRRPVILSVGRLIERKGFDATLFAMPEVLRSVPDAVYEIVGDGPYRDTLVRLAEMVGIRNSVSFRGFLTDEALAEAYNLAHCFVMPTRRIKDDVEGFGIVYLEAASAGLPTIGGIDSGAADAIEDGATGFLVDGRHPSAIAKAIITLLTDHELSTRMGRNGKQRIASNFSWAKVSADIAEEMREHRC